MEHQQGQLMERYMMKIISRSLELGQIIARLLVMDQIAASWKIVTF